MKDLLVTFLVGASLATAAHAAKVNQKTTAKEGLMAGGKTIMLDHVFAERVKTFRKTGATFYYPISVPARYTLSSIKFDPQGEVGHPDYQLEFCDKKHRCLSIESAFSGVGDGPDGDRKLKGKSRFFGSFTIDVLNPGSEGNGGKNVYYISSRLQDKKEIASEKKGTQLPGDARLYHFFGEGINDKEAIAIIESLQPCSAP